MKNEKCLENIDDLERKYHSLEEQHYRLLSDVEKAKLDERELFSKSNQVDEYHKGLLQGIIVGMRIQRSMFEFRREFPDNSISSIPFDVFYDMIHNGTSFLQACFLHLTE